MSLDAGATDPLVGYIATKPSDQPCTLAEVLLSYWGYHVSELARGVPPQATEMLDSVDLLLTQNGPFPLPVHLTFSAKCSWVLFLDLGSVLFLKS